MVRICQQADWNRPGQKNFRQLVFSGVVKKVPDKQVSRYSVLLRSWVRIEVRPTENDSTRLYKNGDISVVITCS